MDIVDKIDLFLKLRSGHEFWIREKDAKSCPKCKSTNFVDKLPKLSGAKEVQCKNCGTKGAIFPNVQKVPAKTFVPEHKVKEEKKEQWRGHDLYREVK